LAFRRQAKPALSGMRVYSRDAWSGQPCRTRTPTVSPGTRGSEA
jgi:hypothetical protein